MSALGWRLARRAAPEWRLYAAGAALTVVTAAVSLAQPLFVRAAIDGRATLPLLTAAMLAGVALRALAGALRHYAFLVAGERTVALLRADVFSRLLDQEIAFFDAQEAGDLGSRLSGDAAVLEEMLGDRVDTATRCVIQLGAGLVLLGWLSPRLTALVVLAGPPLVLAVAWVGRDVGTASRRAAAALGAMQQVATESLLSIRAVRAFAGEDTRRRAYAAALGEALRLGARRARGSAQLDGASRLCGESAVAVVVAVGALLVGRGDLSVGGLIAFVLYAQLVAGAFGDLVEFGIRALRAAGPAARLIEIVDRRPALPGGLRPAAATGDVQMEDVVFAYPTRRAPVLCGLDLRLAPGECVALVGASGAGKSTIARLLLRFYDVQGGCVRFDGVDVRDLDPTWLRSQIALVEQEPVLFSGTIAENVRFGRLDASASRSERGGGPLRRADDASPAEVAAVLRAANAEEFVAAFPDGTETRVGQGGVQLSGGQKQRIAIARALLRDPRVLVLDEATSALDAAGEALVQEALLRLRRGRTTLVIAHRLSTVQSADRVVMLEHGRVVEDGVHDVLVAQGGRYRRLVDHQLSA